MTGPANTTLVQLRNSAENGDATAQYALAATLSGNGGDPAEIEQWLQAAAAQENADALYTLATRCFDSAAHLPDAEGLLARAAAGGSVDAQRLQGVLYAEGYGVAPDWEKGVSCVIGAARQGAPAALRELAMLLFAIDPDDLEGARLIDQAAKRDATAAIIMIRRAASGRAFSNLNLAAQALQQLTRARYPNAAALALALKAQHQVPSAAVSPLEAMPDWDRITTLLSSEPRPDQTILETICEKPNARVATGAFTLEECEYIMASSARLLAPSMIVDPHTGLSRQDSYRSSMTAMLAPVDEDLALIMLTRRMAYLAGRAPDTGEFLGVLHYSPGQQYRAHFDWLPEGEELDRNGQRVTTALIILNDDYQGGETHFMTPDLRFKGRAGDLLTFENVLQDGSPDPATRHAGLPVTSGAKWLGSRWFREKKYNF